MTAAGAAKALLQAAALAVQQSRSDTTLTLFLGSARTFALAAFPDLLADLERGEVLALQPLEEELLRAAGRFEELAGDADTCLQSAARRYTAAWLLLHRRSRAIGARGSADQEITLTAAGAAHLREARRGRG